MGEVSGGVLSGRVVDGGSPPLVKRVMALSLLRPSPFSYAHFCYNGSMFGFGALACSLLPDGAMHATYNLGQYTEDGGVLVTVRYADGREVVGLSARPVLLDLARAIRASLTEKAEELQGRSSEGKQGPVSASDEAEEGTFVFPEWLENLHSITVSDYSYSPKDASTVGWVFEGGRRVSGVTLVKGAPKPAQAPLSKEQVALNLDKFAMRGDLPEERTLFDKSKQLYEDYWSGKLTGYSTPPFVDIVVLRNTQTSRNPVWFVEEISSEYGYFRTLPIVKEYPMSGYSADAVYHIGEQVQGGYVKAIRSGVTPVERFGMDYYIAIKE